MLPYYDESLIFLPVWKRMELYYGAKLNAPDNVHGVAEKAANGRAYTLQPFGGDGDYIFQVERSHQTPERRKLLFIGTGRCGTKYVSQLFTANGVDIGHELCGLDGTASHQFAYDADWHWIAMGLPVGYVHLGEHRSDYEFEHVYHLLRHPLTCIPSMASWFHDCDWRWFQSQDMPYWLCRNDLHSAMYVYDALNRACEAQTSNRIKIEDIDVEFSRVSMEVFGRTFSVQKLPKANQSNVEPQRISWNALLEIDFDLAQSIRELSRRYGYDL